MDIDRRGHAKLTEVRPTQISLGMHEVREKAAMWRAMPKRDRDDFVKDHVFPVVKGRGGIYILDHHHLGRMLLEHGITRVRTHVMADLSALDDVEFWSVMDFHRWTYPYDAQGERRAYSVLPHSLRDMQDDPYRSLAGDVRRAGGFSKDAEPFAEFLWANFFRRRISAIQVEQDYRKSLKRAMKLAHQEIAAFLPGWSGDHVRHLD